MAGGYRKRYLDVWAADAYGQSSTGVHPELAVLKHCRRFTILVTSLIAAASCATAPTTFVAIYGDHQSAASEIALVVARTSPDFTVIDVDPPAGARGPVVIHGASAAAKTAAEKIAYDLYTEFGEWVAVRPVELTNHSYSPEYVAVYVLSDADALAAREKIRASVKLSGSDEYISQQCDHFDGSLWLLPGNRYEIDGVLFDKNGKEAGVSYFGGYERASERLILKYDGKHHEYAENSVHWRQEAVNRVRFVRSDSNPSRPKAFDCNFLQDVKVVQRDGDGDVGDPHPDNIVRLFRRVQAEKPTDLRATAGQQHMQTLAAVGREDKHAAVLDWPLLARQCKLRSDTAVSIVEEVRRQAASARVVLINEAHDRPLTRVLIGEIATGLRDLGFTVFAAETFRPNIEKFSTGAHARVDDGAYTDEPVFGELIRDVKRLGYALRAYEYQASEQTEGLSMRQRIARREEGQANNLVAILAEMEPDERLLVHVGYSHAAEVPFGNIDGEPMAWMGARLKEKAGLDPLTIDQTGCLSDSGFAQLVVVNPRYVEGQFDIIVAQPPLQFSDGRPMYRYRNGASQLVIPASLLPHEHRVIIDARHVGEPLDAVPVDRVMLWPGEVLPLVLPPGDYQLTSFEETTNKQRTATISVNREALSE